MRGVLCLTSHADTLISVRPEAELFIGLQRAGIAVHVLTQSDSPYFERMKAAGVKVTDFHQTSKISFRAIRSVREYLSMHDIDIVYAFNNRTISTAVWATGGLDVKLLTYRGQTGNIERYDPSVLLTHRHARVDGIICVANAIERYLRPRIAPRVLIETVYKGHKPDWYDDAPLERTTLDIPEEAFVIGCVANNRPRKGVEYLVRAFRDIAITDNAHLVLVGSGMNDQLASVMALPADIRRRVHLLGQRPDVGALVQMFDVAVLPAVRGEGLPKTIVEAMAYARACVVTDTGGNAELVQDNVTGYVVSVADVRALVDAIRRMMASTERRRAMGLAGRDRIAREFHTNDSVRQTIRVFERLLEQRPDIR